MPEGLLWFDDSDRTARQKAAQAVARFRRKFPGAEPAVVYVNPDDFEALGEGPRKAAGVEVWPQRATLRHHYFVVGEDQERGGAATWLVACLGLILFVAATACVLAYCWIW